MPPSPRPVTPEDLAALEALGNAGTWPVDGVEVKLTNLDKVLFPADDHHEAVTKRELVRYQARIAPHVLPYLHDRPINLQRFPDGSDHPGFWAKAVPTSAPAWLTRWTDHDARKGRTRIYAVLDRPASLVYVANLAALELHPWTSTAARSDEPTWALVDIDPGTDTTFADVLTLARLHRTALDHLGVEAAAKVTGKRGIQIWIPVAAGTTFDQTRSWVERLSHMIGATVPELVSWEWSTARRGGRARLDFTQNTRNHTLVAPLSPRPAPGAPVSMPIGWEELDDPTLRPDRWTIATAIDRLETVGDPLLPLIGLQQRLPDLG